MVVGNLDSNYKKRLEVLSRDLDAAAWDAERWKDVCDSLASVLDGVGSLLLPIPTDKITYVVHSDGVAECAETFLSEGWNKRDLRLAVAPFIQRHGYSTDYDFASEEMMQKHPYYADFLARHGLQTCIAIGIEPFGTQWVISVQRARGAEPPDSSLLAQIPHLRQMLGQAGRVSRSIAATGIDTWLSYFGSSDRGLVILRRDGRCGEMNAAAERFLARSAIKAGGQIALPDAAAQLRLTALIEQASAQDDTRPLPPPVVTVVGSGIRLVFDVARIPSALRYFHLDATALLIVRPATPQATGSNSPLALEFGLSQSELRAAMALADGLPIREIATRFQLAEGTVRQQLKAVFRKTGVHSQAQLVVLLKSISYAS